MAGDQDVPGGEQSEDCSPESDSGVDCDDNAEPDSEESSSEE